MFFFCADDNVVHIEGTLIEVPDPAMTQSSSCVFPLRPALVVIRLLFLPIILTTQQNYQHTSLLIAALDHKL